MFWDIMLCWLIINICLVVAGWLISERSDVDAIFGIGVVSTIVFSFILFIGWLLWLFDWEIKTMCGVLFLIFLVVLLIIFIQTPRVTVQTEETVITHIHEHTHYTGNGHYEKEVEKEVEKRE